MLNRQGGSAGDSLHGCDDLDEAEESAEQRRFYSAVWRGGLIGKHEME